MASTDTGRRMQKVLQAVEDYIADHEQLPGMPDVAELVDYSDGQVRNALDRLRQNGDLRAAYENPGRVTVYVPTYMWEALLRYRKTPDWLNDYGLEQRKEIEGEIRDKEDRLNRLRRLEDLLHTSGRTLEEAIHTALDVLEVKDLSANFEDPELWDFSFSLDGLFYIADAKGKTKAANKDDAQQLSGWMEQYLEENPDADPDDLCGLLIINHFKEVEPEDRWPQDEGKPPLTQYADKFLGLGGCRRFLTTIDLYDVAAKVINDELTSAAARRDLRTRMRRRLTDE